MRTRSISATSARDERAGMTLLQADPYPHCALTKSRRGGGSPSSRRRPCAGRGTRRRHAPPRAARPPPTAEVRPASGRDAAPPRAPRLGCLGVDVTRRQDERRVVLHPRCQRCGRGAAEVWPRCPGGEVWPQASCTSSSRVPERRQVTAERERWQEGSLVASLATGRAGRLQRSVGGVGGKECARGGVAAAYYYYY